MRKCFCLIVLVFFSLLLIGQEPSAEFKNLKQQYELQYKNEQYRQALSTLNKLLDRPEANAPEVKAKLLYNRAALYSLTVDRKKSLKDLRAAIEAGYKNYTSLMTNRDFDLLRNDPEFKSLIAELKEKYGAAPLSWNAAQKAPEFDVKYDHRDDPELQKLRSEFGLDLVVRGSRDDIDALARLADWTSKQWEHKDGQSASKPDPLTILREAKSGGRFNSRDYAIVLASAAESIGLKARVVDLFSKNAGNQSESHSVIEAWIPALNKWVLADGQYGVVPEARNMPLNAVELQKALAEDVPVGCRGTSLDECSDWKMAILPSLYYFKVADDQRRFEGKPEKQLVLVPVGAAEPQKIAANATYTSNPKAFYEPPK